MNSIGFFRVPDRKDDKMRAISLMSAIIATTSMLAVQPAASDGNTEKKPVVLFGKIIKAVDDQGVIIILPKGKTDPLKDGVKISTNDKTVVVIDGKQAKPADLNEGNQVKVTVVNGIADRIEKIKAEPPKAGA